MSKNFVWASDEHSEREFLSTWLEFVLSSAVVVTAAVAFLIVICSWAPKEWKVPQEIQMAFAWPHFVIVGCPSGSG